MKHINTFNLITGEKHIVPADKYLTKKIQFAISDCKKTIVEHPDIGTVLDGSRFAIQKVLEALEKRINRINDKETLFTDFYESLLYDIEALEAICNNTENVDVKCVLLGQKIGYKTVTQLIEKINKCDDVSESK